MKQLYLLLLLIIGHLSIAQNPEFAKDRIVLSFNELTLLSSVEDITTIESISFLYNEYSIRDIKLLDRSYSKSSSINKRPILIRFNSEIDIIQLINRLKSTLIIDHAEPDFINYGSGYKKQDIFSADNEQINFFTTTPNDQYFFRQWSLHNNGSFFLSPSTADADVDMIEAWDFTTGNPNITMAVMDSGIRMTHPEFSGRLWVNTSEVLNNTDSDANGYTDDINGWDFVNNDNNPADDHGHGTNVTGIATATGNNSIGYAGVDWSCKIMPLKVLNSSNSGFTSDIIESFYYAISKGVKIISISIGGSGFSFAYQTAVNTAYSNGIVVVACMMNFNNDIPYYPAAFTNTIAVGSTDPNDERTEPFFWSSTSGSNYGSHIDVVAPGNYMYGLSHSSDTNYGSYWGGTSQATPLVSGICSLMLDIDPSLTVDQIRNILRSTAEDQVGDVLDTPGWDQYYGAGRVNAFNALQQVQTLSSNEYNEDVLAIYPNPVADNLLISGISTYAMEYTITNIKGQLLKTGDVEGSRIDCSFLSEGIYFIKLMTGTNTSLTKKFIKK